MLAYWLTDQPSCAQAATLCIKSATLCIQAGTEWIETPNSVTAAAELCDGLAKTIYAKAFDWLVSQVNRAVATEH